MIVEYNDKYISDVGKLLEELQEYIVSIDPYHFNIINDDYIENILKIDLDEVNKNNGKIYLALESDKVVGLIMGVIREKDIEYDYERLDRMGEVTELIVTKNIRNSGIGKLLLNKMEEYFKLNNCKTINIDVFGYNDIARSFYSKNGYHERMLTVSKRI